MSWSATNREANARSGTTSLARTLNRPLPGTVSDCSRAWPSSAKKRAWTEAVRSVRFARMKYISFPPVVLPSAKYQDFESLRPADRVNPSAPYRPSPVELYERSTMIGRSAVMLVEKSAFGTRARGLRATRPSGGRCTVWLGAVSPETANRSWASVASEPGLNSTKYVSYGRRVLPSAKYQAREPTSS